MRADVVRRLLRARRVPGTFPARSLLARSVGAFHASKTSSTLRSLSKESI